MAKAPQKVCSTIISVMLAVYGINSLIELFNSLWFGYASDEFQHVHIAWLMFKGEILYQDFWDNHGPLYTTINAIIMASLENPESFDIFWVLRCINFATTLVTAALILVLSRQIGSGWQGGLFAILCYLSLYNVRFCGIQIRPDPLQNLFGFAGISLFIFLQAQQDRSRMFYVLVGILWGIMLGFNFKSGILLVGGGLYLVRKYYTDKSGRVDLMTNSLFIGLGCLAVLFCMAATMAIYGFLWDCVQWAIIENFAEVRTRSATWRETLFFLTRNDKYLAIVGLASLLFINMRDWRHQFLVLTLLPTAYGIYVGLYPQYNLVFIPIFCIFSSLMLSRLCLSGGLAPFLTRQALAIISIAALFGQPAFNLQWQDRILEKEREKDINWVLTNVSREEPILRGWDGCAAVGVFNPHIGFFHSPYTNRVVSVKNRVEEHAPRVIALERPNFLEQDSSYSQVFEGSCVWIKTGDNRG